jgi:hypothetical protein
MVDSPAMSTGRALFLRLFLISVGCLFAACQTPRYTEKDWDVPLTLRTVGPAYADYVLEVADTNRDRKVTYVEWMNASGSKRTFELIDQNRDGVGTHPVWLQRAVPRHDSALYGLQ